MIEFRLNIAPFVFQVTTNSQLVVANCKKIYSQAYTENLNSNVFVDYRVSLENTGAFRRFFKPQSRFKCDDREPFKPLPANHAFAMLEWGMNWIIASHELQYVIVHSAVLAKGDIAVMFPAPPGSGKSTLTAHLANNGWRLLSDEMALILPNTNQVIPFTRAICLKNNAIELAQGWFPQASFSSIAHATHKGNVIHMAPNTEATNNANKPATLKGIVFPKYDVNIALDIYQLNMTETYLQMVHNAFNFRQLGNESFDTVTQLIESCKAFEVHYNDLNEIDSFLVEEIIDATN